MKREYERKEHEQICFVCVNRRLHLFSKFVPVYSQLGMTHVRFVCVYEYANTRGHLMACYKSEVLGSKLKITAHKGKDQILVLLV